MLYDEELFSLTEAAKELPPIDGQRVNRATLFRWASRGIRGVRLQTLMLGGRLVTSREALERFSRELGEKWFRTRQKPTKQSKKKLRPRKRAAQRELDRLGGRKRERVR